MLVKNENEYCWVFDDDAGDPITESFRLKESK